MKTHLTKLKAELKVLALEIRQLKSTRKQCPHGYVSGLGYAQNEFRIKHIAGCMRTAFVEPHWDNRMTAVACYGCDEHVKDLNLI